MPRWDAFVSYASADARIAGRVQRWLERYRLAGGRRLSVYRDETDIAGGALPAQLREALAESACLVVCCSQAAAQSHWVNLEIASFEELARGRPILPVLVADEPPDSLPPALGRDALRWADLRRGWRFGRPRRATRVELVRLVAGIAGIDFRELLPLDRRRRQRNRLTVAGSLATAGFILAWTPVLDWRNVTPASAQVQVFHCEQLDDGIAYFMLNESFSIKNNVAVVRNVLGRGGAGGGAIDRTPMTEIVPRGRMLPAHVNRALRSRCNVDGATWLGEPAPGTCIALRESEEPEFVADPMGGFESTVTDVIVNGGEPFHLSTLWRRIDEQRWAAEYGRSLTPSNGLPVAAAAADLWLGFPQDEFSGGTLWRSRDRGASWEAVRGISDVRSIRALQVGILIAARLERQPGFFLLRDSVFTPFDVPDTGADLEVCGEVDRQPVVRTDRTAWLRARRPWWRTRMD
jgi:hypothetical protein